MFRLAIIVAALSAMFSLLSASPVFAQDQDGGDSLLDQINVELDRQGATQGEDALDVAVPARPENILARGFVALLIVLALIFVVYTLARRFGKKVPLIAGSNYATVLGRIHLDRGTALHFVRTGDRVLVVGVNQNSVSLVADMEAGVFEETTSPHEDPGESFNPDSFLAELHAQSEHLKNEGVGLPHNEEDEIAALRGDIQRLQRYLREETRELEE